MTKYWYVEGMMYPYWASYVQEDYPKPGDRVTIWHNKEADTDMGDLYDTEFQVSFPQAREITKEEYYGEV